MPVLPKRLNSIPWFSLCVVGLLLGSLGLRFWGLGRFNTLVFDEVYYANFARGYLKGVQEFGGHPPLSTYFIAFGIWVANHTPWGSEGLKNGLTGMMLTPVSYRWLNALTGSFIPVVGVAIAHQLTHRRSYALIAGLLIAADGLILVESRYALNNIYLVLFGLLGQLCVLIALNQCSQREPGNRIGRVAPWLLLAGIWFGASIGVKWNGLWFLLGMYGVWSAGWVIHWLNRWRPGLLSGEPLSRRQGPLSALTSLNIGQVFVFLGVVPVLTYFLTWIPYIRLDPSTSFWAWQGRILDYHNRVGGMDAHPYCSPWYTWFGMWRPVAYFYKTAQSVQESIPIVGPSLPTGTETVIYDVHAIGNPILWWFSTAAMVLLVGMLVYRILVWVKEPDSSVPLFNLYTWTALYLVVNWVASWLPWVRVTRCTFLYHYMGASMFAFLGIALLVDRWLHHPEQWQRTFAITTILLILLAFLFWLPLYLGLPLSPTGLQIRRWFPSWI